MLSTVLCFPQDILRLLTPVTHGLNTVSSCVTETDSIRRHCWPVCHRLQSICLNSLAHKFCIYILHAHVSEFLPWCHGKGSKEAILNTHVTYWTGYSRPTTSPVIGRNTVYQMPNYTQPTTQQSNHNSRCLWLFMLISTDHANSIHSTKILSATDSDWATKILVTRCYENYITSHQAALLQCEWLERWQHDRISCTHCYQFT